MMMHNNPGKGSPLRGKDMFDEVMGHFGDRVQGIQGIWVYGDNLGGFNAAVSGGSSLVVAAKGAWTWRQAALQAENENMSSAARAYDAGAAGSQSGAAPVLQYCKAGGSDLSQTEFDGYDSVNGVLIWREACCNCFQQSI